MSGPARLAYHLRSQPGNGACCLPAIVGTSDVGLQHRREVVFGRTLASRSSGGVVAIRLSGAVSPALRRTVSELGPDAERWLEGIPALVSEVSAAWKLEIGPVFPHQGCASVIVQVTTERGVPAILKLSVPQAESKFEAEALRNWNGNGAVLLLRSTADGFTLLLERCFPGEQLLGLGVDEQTQAISELLPRIWVPPDSNAPFPSLAETATYWAMTMDARAAAIGLPHQVADRAEQWAVELAAYPTCRLLHGDFHPGNIVSARRCSWLAIDPKPWVGDPAFDLAQVLASWVFLESGVHGGAAMAIRARSRKLADRLSLDHEAVLRWALVKAIGWNARREGILILDEAARKA